MIVVDVNVLAAATISANPAQSAQVEAVFRRDSEWVAPPLWRSEFRNLLAGYLRLRGWSVQEGVHTFNLAVALVSQEPGEIPAGTILQLVEQSTCTAYDLEFVALAHSLDVPLVTFDRQLLDQFPGTAVHPVDFAV